MNKQGTFVNCLPFGFLAKLPGWASAVVLLSLFACGTNHGEQAINGGRYFADKCAGCHGLTGGFASAPSVVSMAQWDSAVLIVKLKGLSADTVHSGFVVRTAYATAQVDSVFSYIRSAILPIEN